MRLLLISNESSNAVHLFDWLKTDHELERVFNPPLEPTDMDAQSIIAGEEHLDGIIEFVACLDSSRPVISYFAKEWVRQYRPKLPHILLASSDFIEQNIAHTSDSSYSILSDSASPAEIVRLLEGLIRKDCR
jgi:hypothetical protein